MIELKGSFAGDTRLATRTADVLAGYGGPVAAMSFDPGLMAALRISLPRSPSAWSGCGATPARRPAQMSALRYLRQALAAAPCSSWPIGWRT